MDEYRPDPDELLAVIQKVEDRQQRGKLKIFFGMAAGVGKTYTMLDNARQRQAEGVDDQPVIGVVGMILIDVEDGAHDFDGPVHHFDGREP